MEAAPASPSPSVSEDSSDGGDEMDTDDEEGLLAYTGQDYNSESSSEGFEHV